MRLTFRHFFRPWMLVPIAALGFLIWATSLRVQRVRYVTDIAEWSVAAPRPDPTSPTGHTGGVRRLIVPEHHNRSYQWILETQQMLARNEWRVRHVDYDNAPLGRETHAPSLYRWWLGLVAWGDQLFSSDGNRALSLSVERAAIFAEPLLQILLLVWTTFFVARQFGIFPAALLSVGIVALFPFAGGFLPGVPDVHGWANSCAIWSVLPLLAGLRATETAVARKWFLVAGAAGGLGLWFSVATEVPILAGIVLGALSAIWFARGQANSSLLAAPWRAWALGGCATTLLAYMVEYFPAHMSLQLQAIHPLYAIAWLGGGELLARIAAWKQSGKFPRRFPEVATLLLAAASVAVLPIAMQLSENRGFLAPNPLSSHLTLLNAEVANHVADWIAREGISAPVVATILPILLVVVALVFVGGRSRATGESAPVVLALGPGLVALGFASFQLHWFNLLDALLLPLLVAMAATIPETATAHRSRWWWSIATGLVVLPGVIQLWPPVRAGSRQALSEIDVESVVARDLAHWLAQRTSGQAVVLASPDFTVSLAFHGGLRGLGTLDWENKDGLAAAVRIAAATSPQEALALIQQRGVTHIILPSWESSLEEFAKLGSSLPERSFATALKRWAPLVWLRPLPYQIPRIAGFEDRNIAIFEVVEEQEESTTLIRQTEYFVEMGNIDLAAGMRQKLQRFPADLGALVALAQVEVARQDSAAFATVLNSIVSSLSAGTDRSLAWERRVSLATVLAQGKRANLAREQVRRCLAEIDESRIRDLTPESLFRLLVLAKNFGLEISDPRVRAFALQQLPPDAKERL